MEPGLCTEGDDKERDCSRARATEIKRLPHDESEPVSVCASVEKAHSNVSDTDRILEAIAALNGGRVRIHTVSLGDEEHDLLPALAALAGVLVGAVGMVSTYVSAAIGVVVAALIALATAALTYKKVRRGRPERVRHGEAETRFAGSAVESF